MSEEDLSGVSGEEQEDISKGRPKDLGSTVDLKQLWDPQDPRGSLDAVFRYVAGDAKEAIEWYLRSKRRKKRWARLFRTLVVLSGALAGVIPLLIEMGLNWPGGRSISPAWASLFVAIAGTMVALDRLLGCSSGWVRYISSEMRVRRILEEFRIDWAIEKAVWKNGTPDADQVRGMLERAKAFNMQVNAIVQEETNAWITEFKTNVKEIDEAVKAKAEAMSRGGLNVMVTNGDECTDGWKLSIDGGSVRSYIGKTAALSDLAPGSHTLRVEGTIDNSERRAEKLASVPAGGIGNVEVTLSGLVGTGENDSAA